MTIEIHQPELKALIQERMAAGNFVSVEEFLRQALETETPLRENADNRPFLSGADLGAAPMRMPHNDVDVGLRSRFEEPEPTLRMTLREAFEAGRGLGEGLDITRNPSFARPVEL
jgi:hypothetical protein